MSKSSISILAKEIATSKGLTQAEAERFISQMFSVANDAIQEEKQLKMKWLGTFKVTAVKDRESVDVNTGERIVIEGRDKITFTPDNILKEIVNRPFAQFETVVVNDGVDFSDIDEKFAQIESLALSDVDAFSEELDISSTKSASEEISKASEKKPLEENVPSSEVKPSDDSDLSLGGNVAENSVDMVSENSVNLVPENENPSCKNSESNEMQSKIAPDSSNVSSEANELAEQIIESVPESAIEHVVASSSCNLNADEVEEADDSNNHHFVIPKYMVAVACVVFVALLGAVCFFAYNYGMMQEQQKNLQVQLADLMADSQRKAVAQAAKHNNATVDSAQIALREKARQDSLRMAAANEAISMAEKADSLRKAQGKQADKLQEKQSDKQDVKQANEKQSVVQVDDPRVRTGAYRIVGVAQTVTAHEGQTLQSISRRYLGPGMDCYVEALNGFKEVKAGQKVKIPKLELKKKSK